MRKRVILALMLAAALVLTTSCSLIVKDAEVDKQTVIIEVGGKTFTKGEISEQVEYTLDYQEYIYSMYGMPFDRTSDSAISDAQSNVIDGLIQQTVIENKISEMGMDQFTDEELAEMQTTADETYQNNLDSLQSGEFAETELTGDELTAAVEARAVELGYATKEQLLENEKTTKSTEKLREEVVKDVSVSDEEIQTSYDAKVAEEKLQYESNLPAYGSAVQNGTTVYYTPAGYRYVKNILRNISDEDSTKISDLESQISSKQTELSTAEASLAEMDEDASADDENAAASRAALTSTKETLDSEIAELNTQLDAAKEAAYAAIQPTVDEILAKLEAGEDFDAVMEEYGEDPGMQSSPGKEEGYLVCEGSTTWVSEFTEAAMALEKIGDVSPAVRTSYGTHILQYVSDAREGEVGLEAVKDIIQSELLTEKQDALYNETVEQWVTDANAKIYMDRMAD